MRIPLAMLLVLLTLGSCGGSGSKTATVSSSPGPTGSSGPAGSPQPKPTGESPGRARRPARSSAGSNVKVSFLQKALFGARSQVVYFIAKGPGQPLAQAKSCVERNLRRAPSAYCFAFSSERAFRFSHVSRHPPAKMERPCWVAYWGKPSGRRAIGSSTNPAAVPLHCPGAIG